MDEMRSRRVAQAMREELSELIRFESSDPRITDVEVTEVVVAPDLRRADVLISLPGNAESRDNALIGLEHARNFLRRRLMQRLDLYRMPELHFKADTERSGDAPIGRLLRRMRRGRPKDDVKAD
jgi:ribosome-binding factor A